MNQNKSNFKVSLIITSLLCIISVNAFSQSTFNWVIGMGGTGTDNSAAIDRDSNGNIYVVGSFTGTANFGVNFSAGSATNGFLVKMDPSGNYIWSKHLSGLTTARINDIKIDPLGNIYMTGEFNNSVDFDMGPGDATLTTSILTSFILKLDQNGDYLWAKKLDPIAPILSNNGNSIDFDASGNIYIAGEFQNSADFNPGAGIFSMTSNGSTDIYVLKLDASGNFLWAKQFGGTSGDLIKSLHVDASGDIYTVGSFQGSVDFDPGAGATIYTANNTDIYISKLNTNGVFVYAKQIGGSGIDRAWAISTDANGDVYITGNFSGTVDFDPGVGTNSLTASSTDIFILKLDVNGNFNWAKKFGAGNGLGISINASNEIFITGNYTGTSDFNPGGGVFNLTSSGSNDVFISRLDNNGDFISAISIGSTGNDLGRDILLNNSGDVYILGNYNATVDFNPFAGTNNLISFGGTDVFLLKLSYCIAPPDPTNTTPVSNLTICNGSSAMLSASSGSNTINWYATASSPTILGTGNSFTTPVLSAGTYSYFAEASGCVVSESRTEIMVTVLSDIASSISAQTNVSCNDGSNGAATVVASGGAGSYTYSWSPTGGTSSTATGLVAGTYTCTITDVNGCIKTQTVTITEPGIITSVISSQTNVACNGGSNGAATVVASGGAGAYTYSWSPTGGTSSTATGLVAGTYTCTITDANGCIKTQTLTITEPGPIVSSQSVTLCAGESLTIGANTYTSSGTYTDVLTAVNGCDSTVTTHLIVNPIISSSNSYVICFGLSVTVGSNTYSTSGTYTDVFTATNGCDSTVTTNLTVHPAIDITTSISGNTITANATSGTFQWIDCTLGNTPVAGETNQSFTPTTDGNYAVVISDNGCSETSSCVNILINNIEEMGSINGTIILYPNPSTGLFTIQSDRVIGELAIYNFLGELIYTDSINYPEKEINLTSLSNGVYIGTIHNRQFRIVISK
ncbi:MAG TPA: T9SS type A sorting domain-containing protein [Flavobacteriales bacterium]|nr:T9SS type A sorting domain-containing protein [Flavobacteriales bacterium]